MIKKGREKGNEKKDGQMKQKGKNEIDGIQNFRIGFKINFDLYFRIQIIAFSLKKESKRKKEGKKKKETKEDEFQIKLYST